MPHKLLLLLLLLYIILHRIPRLCGGPALHQFIPEARPRFKTGDLLLFSGLSSDSLVIQCWTDEIFTHIGLIYTDPAGAQSYVWNADVETDVPCVIQNKCTAGVQLQLLDDKIKVASGYVYYLPWTKQERPVWDWAWMASLCGPIGFRHNVLALARAALPSIVPTLFIDDDKYYCTELVALTIGRCLNRYFERQTTPLKCARQLGYDFTQLRAFGHNL